jgi:MarR family transcriptional regulator, organic hydroperoxide resistance regulator
MIDSKLDKAIAALIWNIEEIHCRLDDLHNAFATSLGISQSQWLVLIAVIELDDRTGVAAIDISSKLRVPPAFVVIQIKRLEKDGFLSRTGETNDARSVLVSLTTKAKTAIEKLSERKSALNLTMFSAINEETLGYLTVTLATIAKNAQLAARSLSSEGS